MPPAVALDIPHPSTALSSGARTRWPLPHLFVILLVWSAVFATALRTPPLLDDADATHAQAAQSMLHTGDWVTLHVNGIRYLEKAPLPYWIAALSLRLFGVTAFAIHLPLALTVLALALLGYAWTLRAFRSFPWAERAALYTALFTLTALGVFLFTRIFIPDALLSLFLAFALYSFLRALDPLEPNRTRWAYTFWIALACAVLTKGLVAVIFIFGAAAIFFASCPDARQYSRLKIFRGLLLFLALAAPWHILAELRNRGSSTGRGFLWFYFVNEHFLRFLGRRTPDDYNKLPTLLYWSLHLIWLFPWSLFAPAALLFAWRQRRETLRRRDLNASGERLSRFELLNRRQTPPSSTLASRTVRLLAIYSLLVLIFFSLSTNQEYYTFPAWLPLLMLLAAALAAIEYTPPIRSLQSATTFAYAAFTVIGVSVAAALASGLWTSRHLPFQPDIGAALAHRGVGSYTLSLSHFFDLTTPSFAALRLPAALAAVILTLGPLFAWIMHNRRKPLAAILTVAFTSAAFLITAHLALTRFTPMLSSHNFAQRILDLERSNTVAPGTQVILYGDQSFGSSIPFYLDRRVFLVDGRSSSMLFGSTFPDAPPIFLTPAQLRAQWTHGPRKILFVPLEKRDEVDRLLGPQQVLLDETSGKALLTDRPLP